jgi:hypothetical protein
VISATKTILVALGIFDNTDALAAVRELKAAFDDAITRTDEHSTMKAIADLLAPAETAL